MQKKNIAKKSLALHRRLGGKITIEGKATIASAHDLALLYTPGVGAVSSFLAKHPRELGEYTIKKNSVAVISDGSAVLGLGNIGPAGAIPVLEGKALIFKKFGGVDAFPIALATQNTEEIISVIRAIAPIFGGINLEDFSAPRCFEIEKRLTHDLSIPVMHDDQHGTAIVVLAALVNAARLLKRPLERLRVVINGAGPAGTATAYLLRAAGVRDIIMLDSHGILSQRRRYQEPYKKELMHRTNPRKISGNLDNALLGADVFIGVSRANLLDEHYISLMARNPIVFALANPIPEIMPDVARRGGAAVVATGRSDFPNQINNALVFPGVFRGALDHHVRRITEKIKLRAAYALSGIVRRPSPDSIIPSIFNPLVVRAIARAIQ